LSTTITLSEDQCSKATPTIQTTHLQLGIISEHQSQEGKTLGRSAKRSSKRTEASSDDHTQATQDHEQHSASCPRCQFLESRIAELEKAASERSIENQPSAPGNSKILPHLDFKALRLIPHGWGEGWQLRPSPARRHWMDELPHAYKCLPLVVANQWGWQVLCPTDVIATWDGRAGLEGLRVEVPSQFAPAIKSQFGAGIVTFSPPWLFRTPPGWDLYLKGPSNRWKPNCVPLEGVIETWWLNYTFTLNWKLVQPGTVVFRQGESLGQLLPVPHSTFEDATALESPIGLLEPKASTELLEWQERRQSIAAQKDNVHHLYRKAAGIEDHLQRVDVPPFQIIGTEEALRLKGLESGNSVEKSKPTGEEEPAN
jgi:Family of unknown function (DUF6065)